MKSRTLVWLALLIVAPGVQVAAQVVPLGQIPQNGGVEQASCQSCAGTSGGFYGGTMWGTTCFDCNHKPGLFPPCPNPCQTTLLGELVYDVKTAVDGTLSRVFGCMFGHPCGYGGSVCGEPMCDTCGGGYTYDTGGFQETMIPSTPSSEYQNDPFGDDPAPTPALQPVPRGSTTRSIMPRSRASAHRAVAQRTARQVSHQTTVATRVVKRRPQPVAIQAAAAQPLRTTATVPQHRGPRRRPSLRRANGETLQSTPVRPNGSRPPLRFRSASPSS